MAFYKFYFTEIYSNWVYKPDNVYKSIYDFYALSLINTDLIRDEELAYALKEAKITIVNYIRNFLLEQLEKAVLVELTHYTHFKVLDAYTGNYVPEKIKNNIKLVKFYKQYVKNFGDPKKVTSGKLVMLPEVLVQERLYDDAYEILKEFMNKYKYNTADIFIIAKEFFNDKSGWLELYGGKNWIKIAEAGLKVLDLKNEKNIDKAMAILDHVFDIEHNTGSIFTKSNNLDVYKIKGILDDKRDITNEVSYYERISSGLKEPYIAAIKNLTGKTIESEKHKIELEDMIKIIKTDPKHIKYMKTAPIEVKRYAVEIDPHVITFINKPEVELMKLAINKDPDVFKKLKPEDKNRLPKEYVQNLFGFN